MENGDKGPLVLNHKQEFQDCEAYAKLEQWLDNKLMNIMTKISQPSN